MGCYDIYWGQESVRKARFATAMDKKVITRDEEKEIVGYLQNHARK